MQKRANMNRKVIVSLLVALMVVFTAFPAAVFADTTQQDYSVTINDPGPIYSDTAQFNMTVSGDTETMEALADGDIHLEWSILEGKQTGIASLNTRGVFTPISAGTVTAVANLRTGPFVAGASDPTGTDIMTTSMAIQIYEGAYGYQGEGGNSLKMLDPSDVDFLDDSQTIGGKTLYENEILDLVPLNNGIATFTYAMSAGMNSFNPLTFDEYVDEIKVYYAANGNLVSNSSVELVYPTTTGSIDHLTISVSGLSSSNDYILQFGPDVSGQNLSKKLGCYINFAFTTSYVQ